MVYRDGNNDQAEEGEEPYDYRSRSNKHSAGCSYSFSVLAGITSGFLFSRFYRTAYT